MKFRVTFSPQATRQFHDLSAYDRAKIRDAIDEHLQHRPTVETKSRIKRLREMRKPQYRLRGDTLRIFYDVAEDVVIVLGIVDKTHAEEWLAGEGEQT